MMSVPDMVFVGVMLIAFSILVGAIFSWEDLFDRICIGIVWSYTALYWFVINIIWR